MKYSHYVSESVRTNSIVRVASADATSTLHTELESAATGSVETETEVEYWGGESPEDEWRVHVARADARVRALDPAAFDFEREIRDLAAVYLWEEFCAAPVE